MDIIVTLSAGIEWQDYRLELEKAAAGEDLNFKVGSFPKDCMVGERCYLVWRKWVRGYMVITGFEEKSFNCTTTGKQWKGKFIVRSGKFHPVEPVEYKGFQGWRYYEEGEV